MRGWSVKPAHFAGHIAFRRRNLGSWNRQRGIAAIACLALVPVATRADAILGVAAIAIVGVALIVYEAVVFRHTREVVRTGGMPAALMRDAQ